MVLISSLALVMGVLLIGWSAFLYESEEKRIADALERWWINLDDVGAASLKWNVAVARRLAATVTAWLDHLFGVRLMSSEAIATSICLSFSSGFTVLAVFGTYYAMAGYRSRYDIPIPFLLIALFAGSALAFILAVSRNRYVARLRVVTAALIIAGCVALIALRGFQYAGGFAVAILVSVSCDFGMVVLTRRLATWTTDAQHIFRPICATVVNVAFGFTLFLVPLIMATRPSYTRGVLMDIVGFTAVSNLFAGVIAISFVIVPMTLLIQRLFWPILARPLYAIQRFRLLQNRSVLFYTGTTLLTTAIPGLAVATGVAQRIFAR